MSTQHTAINQQPALPADMSWCEPCRQRRLQARAVRVVAGTPMCLPCFRGEVPTAPAPQQGLLTRRERLALLAVQGGPRAAHKRARAASEVLVLPYMEQIDHDRCVACGAPRARHQRVCHKCRKLMLSISAVKSYLRSWRDNGNVRCLCNAAAIIRRLGLLPEDLRDF